MCILGGRRVRGEAIKENQGFFIIEPLRVHYPWNLVKAFECEYVLRLTRSQMCRRAAWPGRFLEKDDNLENNSKKRRSKVNNVCVCKCSLMCICEHTVSVHACVYVLCMTLTSFRLKVGNAVHDDMVKEQGFVVDLDVSGEQAAEILHIPELNRGKE